MSNVRVSLPTLLAIVLVVAAGAFAAGKSVVTPAASSGAEPAAQAPPAHAPPTDELPLGHPPMGAGKPVLPPGHVPVADPSGMTGAAAPAASSSLTWKAPPRWTQAPNTSSMRLATYRIPGPDGEAEVSVSQAGGSIEANATRWIGQFDSDAQRTAKQTTKKVGGLDVTIVEVKGNYSGGMSGDGGSHMALLGAIVATPGMPHFFKITGPEKTVLAARGELDQLLASMAPSP